MIKPRHARPIHGERSARLDSGPASRDIPLAERERMLERLLQLTLDLPDDLSEAEVLARCLDCYETLLPELAVGLVTESATGGEPRVVLGRSSRALATAPALESRLFPTMPHEHVLELGDGLRGTLHFAATQQRYFSQANPYLLAFERAAAVLCKAAARSRANAQAQRALADVSRLQAQFIQAEKLASLGQIVAGVVHELNNPLTSILSYAEHLRASADTWLAPPANVERLERISEAAERILRLTRDLVSYARPARHEPSSVDLAAVIRKSLFFCEHELTQNAVRVEEHIAPELPSVRGVFDQLTQVFVNLFTNAAHAMAAGGGTLHIRASADPGARHILVEVADDGLGMDPATLSQIFEPFFTTKEDGRGTGLGLAIVREIVDAHGGRLAVRSVPRQGSVFSLQLPISS